MGEARSQSKKANPIYRLWQRRPVVDLAIALLPSLALAAFHLFADVSDADLLADVSAEDRAGMWLAIGGIVGLLNAFSLAALSFYRSQPGPRMRVLQRQVGDTIKSSWVAGLATSLAVVGGLIVAAVLERSLELDAIRWIALYGVTVAIVTGVRLTWVFIKVLHVDDADVTATAGVDPPVIQRGGGAKVVSGV